MRKAVIYARYSSDLQSGRSIDDQVALCEEFARREELDVGCVYSDRALSGASTIGRNGLLSMMEAARRGEFSVLVVEALDRISRDQEDLAGIYKRLSFADIEIRAVHDGKAARSRLEYAVWLAHFICRISLTRCVGEWPG